MHSTWEGLFMAQAMHNKNGNISNDSLFILVRTMFSLYNPFKSGGKFRKKKGTKPHCLA